MKDSKLLEHWHFLLLSMAVGQELVQLAAPLWAQTLRRAAPGLSGNKTNDNSQPTSPTNHLPKQCSGSKVTSLSATNHHAANVLFCKFAFCQIMKKYSTLLAVLLALTGLINQLSWCCVENREFWSKWPSYLRFSCLDLFMLLCCNVTCFNPHLSYN